MRLLLILILFLGGSFMAEAQRTDSLYQLANEKIAAAQYEAAVELYTASLIHHPRNFYAYFNRGFAKTKLKRYRDATSDYDTVISLRPDFKRAWLGRGIARKSAFNLAGAMSDFMQAISLDPAYAEAYYYRGMLFDLMSEPKQACADYQKAKDPGLVAAATELERCNKQDGSNK